MVSTLRPSEVAPGDLFNFLGVISGLNDLGDVLGFATLTAAFSSLESGSLLNALLLTIVCCLRIFLLLFLHLFDSLASSLPNHMLLSLS